MKQTLRVKNTKVVEKEGYVAIREAMIDFIKIHSSDIIAIIKRISNTLFLLLKRMWFT